MSTLSPAPDARRFLSVTAAAAALAVLLAATAIAAEGAARPNLVLIMADDLGYGDLSAFDGWIETPRIDRLAASGLRLTDYHSNGAVCSPTRAALMTGRYQQRAGLPMVVSVRLRHLGLQPSETTVAELLHEAGYATGIFGKWHLGYRPEYNPVRHGFDRFQGYVSGNVDFFSHVDQSGVFDWWRQDKLLEEEGYTTQLITKHALEFIDAHREAPFFLYLPHEAPHYPYQGPNDKAERTVGGKFPTHGSREDKKQAYREMVEAMDESVGQVLDRLEQHQLREDTLVIFCSDNGATTLGSNGPLRGHKGTVWEGGHRVPAIAAWPGRIRPGVSHATTIGMDWMPTLLALAGVAAPKERPLDGVDLSPLLLEGKPPESRTLFWQHGGSVAMRDGPWKLVRQSGRARGAGLFDLAADLGEQKDLRQTHPERAKSMSEAIDNWQTDMQRTATPQPEP